MLPIRAPASNGILSFALLAEVLRFVAKPKTAPFFVAPFSVITMLVCVVPVGIAKSINATGSGNLRYVRLVAPGVPDMLYVLI